ncbi:MAG: MotA/TolQ/ExbB proton channel family protein [Candidatus Cloacimonetes bacterium]|nr:MotA/TolQ/ExbB proton channel family protein [Candidatus Cloacimonadota bacterium]
MRKHVVKTLLVAVVLSIMLFGTALYAQNAAPETQAEQVAAPAATTDTETPVPEESSDTKNIAEFVFGSKAVRWFNDGGWAMWPILLVTVYGLAYVIWKFVTLIYGKINLNVFLSKIMPLIKDKKYKEALELAKKTRGPVASIVYAGLLKVDSGVAGVEKAIENAAMIEMSYLEKGFIELSTTITLAPMLGFLGTVSGMISAFAAIAAARAVDATIVASGIMIALITTQAGLIVAIPVQFFNNIFVTMVDGLVIDMQRASEKVIETLIENK